MPILHSLKNMIYIIKSVKPFFYRYDKNMKFSSPAYPFEYEIKCVLFFDDKNIFYSRVIILFRMIQLYKINNNINKYK